MKILIDVNLTPRWRDVLGRHGFEARHWTDIGSPAAPDEEILSWARRNGYVILTHDLDFSAILAATDADAPSVIQVRTPNSRPEGMQSVLIATLRQYQDELLAGALIVVEPARSRVRRLPIRRKESQ